MLDLREQQKLARTIARTADNVRRVLRENRQPSDEEVKEPRLGVLVVSERNELRSLESILFDHIVGYGLSLDNNHVQHVNVDKLTPVIARGDIRVAIVLSKRVWGAALNKERTKDLHNSLVTTSQVLGIPIHDLVYYV